MNEKKITITVLVILAVGLIISGLSSATYALFQTNSYGTNREEYSTGMLAITASSKTDTLTLSNALPMTDSDGLETNPYVFTIKNVGNLDYEFDVRLLSTGNSDTTFPANLIKIQINDGEVTTLDMLDDSKLNTSPVTLAAGETIDFSIRVWLSMATTNEYIGRIFESKIVTDGKAIYTSTNSEVNTLVDYISNLYNSASKTVVTNNSIEYNYATSVNLMNDRLGGTTANYDAGNIRYYGATPNNYVYFNCETYPDINCEKWRIIGVFDGKVKLIRDESIGDFAWDNKDTTTGSETDFGKNDWTTARLMKLLNPSDYYTIDSNDNGLGQSLYYTGSRGRCYSDKNNATKACDFTSSGLKNDTTRNMIEEVTWNLGGWNTSGVYSNQIYGYERGITVYQGRPTEWVGKIAIMYASDYGYATDFSKCSQKLYNYNSSTNSYACRSNDWLFNNAYNWLLTTVSSNSSITFYVRLSGNVVYDSNIYNMLGVRPVLYLNANTILKGGSGTSTDPYVIE